MTTTVKVLSHNYPVLVRTRDKMSDREVVNEQVFTAESGEQLLYCTTTRTLEIVDLDYNDPRVLADKQAKEAQAAG